MAPSAHLRFPLSLMKLAYILPISPIPMMPTEGRDDDGSVLVLASAILVAFSM